MDSRFSYIFGFSFVLIGLLCVFLDIKEYISAGLTISAFFFSSLNFIISFFNNYLNKKLTTLLYLIPFGVMIFFCCFGDAGYPIDGEELIVANKILNCILFTSFGIIFVSEYFNFKVKAQSTRNYYKKIIDRDMVYSDNLLKELKKVAESKGAINKQSIKNILSIIEQQIKEDQMRSYIINHKKSLFSLEDLDGDISKFFNEDIKNIIE